MSAGYLSSALLCVLRKHESLKGPKMSVLTSVVDNLSAQDGSHLQHSDEGLVHRGEGEWGHTVPPGHLGDVHCTVT